MSSFVLRPQPTGADDDQNDIALSHLVVQMGHEVFTNRDVIDVHKELVAAERLREPVMQPTGHAD